MAWPVYAQPRADTGVFVAAPAPGYIDYCAANGVTCHYVLAGGGASGTTGADWAHACSDFTGSCAVSGLVRGDRYYVGTGTYAARTFSTSESGTLMLTILGATASDHGTATGWSTAFSVSSADGGAQAQWSNDGNENVQFTKSYITFDGSVGSGNSISSYGFLLKKPANCAAASPQVGVDVFETTQTTVTISHVAGDACSQGEEGSGLEFNTSQLFLNAGCAACNATNITFSHNYGEHWGVSINWTNVHASLIERNWFEKHFYSGTNSGKEPLDFACFPPSSPFSGVGLCDANIVRYNMVRDAANPAGHTSGGFAFLGDDPSGAHSDVINGWFVYGNIFANIDSNGGAMAAINNGSMRNTVVVQNTFDTLTKFFKECEAYCAIAGNNTVQNNLLYSSATNYDLGECACGGAITHDHNSYYSSTDTPPTETGGQITTGNPFVNRASNNFHLAADTSTRASLGAPYNVDADGVTITSSRGAFQYVP